jgi:transposase
LAGTYDRQLGDQLITYGHSKDNRPDLKQIVYGLTVSKDGIPVLGEVLAGNTSDKTWNQGMIQTLRETLGLELAQLIYVADSAMVTKENLRLLAEQRLQFISRLPANFGLLEDLKRQAWERNAWVEVDSLTNREGAAVYRIQELEQNLYGQTYRFVVVHSSHLDTRKQKTLQRLIGEERKERLQAAETLGTKVFACQTDAERAASEFLVAYEGGFCPVEVTVREETVVKRQPGRPRKDEKPPEHTQWRIDARVLEVDSVRKAQWQDQASVFVLITNVSALTHDAKRILHEYKEQNSVEVRFRFLKDPFLVDQFYLKNKDRLEALAYFFLIALLLATLMERRVRKTLAETGTMLIGPDGVKHSRPTARMLLEMFQDTTVLAVPSDGGPYRRLPDLRPKELRALELMGFSETIYSRPYPAA